MSVKFGDDLELILGATVTGLPDPVGDTDAAARAWVIQQISDAITAAGGLDPEAVQDIVGAMFADTSTLDVTYNDSTGAVTLTVLDSPTVDGETPADLRDRSTHTGTQVAATISDFAAAVVTAVNAASNIDADTLGGSTAAQLQTTITAAIVNGAGSTLDTLNELAAALGNDPNFATTVTNALAARVQSFDTTVGDGAATTFNVDHNLNTRKVTVQVYETGDDFEQVWASVKRPTVNRVTVAFASAPTAGQYTVVVQGKPGA